MSLYEREHTLGLHANWACPGCPHCPSVPAPQVAVPAEPAPQMTPAEQRRHSFTSLGEATERLRAQGKTIKATDPDRPSAPDGPPDGGPDCEVCHGFRKLRRDVPVEHPDFGKSFDCPKCFQGFLLQQRLDKLVGSLPDRYKSWTLASFPQTDGGQRQVVHLGKQWLSDQNQPWLLALGRSGRGKTGLVVGLLKIAMAEHHRVATFKDAFQLLALLKSTYGSRDAFDADEHTIMTALQTVDLLVLDDVARGSAREWATEVFSELLAVRHATRKQTVITCNWNIDELTERLGYPTVSRIQEAAGRYQLDFSRLPNLRSENSAA
jgi:DNA replication protein DnaC